MSWTLDIQHKHVMKLIARDCNDDGWASISESLYPSISGALPPELVELEKLEHGGRARLTDEGNNILSAMKWL